MYCRECGQQVNDKAVVCLHCGCSTENTEDRKNINTIQVNVSNTNDIPKHRESGCAIFALYVFSVLIPYLTIWVSIYMILKNKEEIHGWITLAISTLVLTLMILGS